MARNDPQVNMRMSEQLKRWLDEAATANNRSLTAEIAARLEASFDAELEAGDRRVKDAVLTAIQAGLADHVLTFFEQLPKGAQQSPMNIAARNMAAAIRAGGIAEIKAALAGSHGAGPSHATDLLAADLVERRQYLEELQAKLAPKTTTSARKPKA